MPRKNKVDKWISVALEVVGLLILLAAPVGASIAPVTPPQSFSGSQVQLDQFYVGNLGSSGAVVNFAWTATLLTPQQALAVENSVFGTSYVSTCNLNGVYTTNLQVGMIPLGASGLGTFSVGSSGPVYGTFGSYTEGCGTTSTQSSTSASTASTVSTTASSSMVSTSSTLVHDPYASGTSLDMGLIVGLLFIVLGGVFFALTRSKARGSK